MEEDESFQEILSANRRLVNYNQLLKKQLELRRQRAGLRVASLLATILTWLDDDTTTAHTRRASSAQYCKQKQRPYRKTSVEGYEDDYEEVELVSQDTVLKVEHLQDDSTLRMPSGHRESRRGSSKHQTSQPNMRESSRASTVSQYVDEDASKETITQSYSTTEDPADNHNDNPLATQSVPSRIRTNSMVNSWAVVEEEIECQSEATTRPNYSDDNDDGDELAMEESVPGIPSGYVWQKPGSDDDLPGGLAPPSAASTPVQKPVRQLFTSSNWLTNAAGGVKALRRMSMGAGVQPPRRMSAVGIPPRKMSVASPSTSGATSGIHVGIQRRMSMVTPSDAGSLGPMRQLVMDVTDHPNQSVTPSKSTPRKASMVASSTVTGKELVCRKMSLAESVAATPIAPATAIAAPEEKLFCNTSMLTGKASQSSPHRMKLNGAMTPANPPPGNTQARSRRMSAAVLSANPLPSSIQTHGRKMSMPSAAVQPSPNKPSLATMQSQRAMYQPPRRMSAVTTQADPDTNSTPQKQTPSDYTAEMSRDTTRRMSTHLAGSGKEMLSTTTSRLPVPAAADQELEKPQMAGFHDSLYQHQTHQPSFYDSDIEKEPSRLQIDYIKPTRRLMGEVAFQLDRRVLNYVFCDSHEKKQKKRFYGFILKNIPDRIMRESCDESGQLDPARQHLLHFRYSYLLRSLAPLGYDVNRHSDISAELVNKYGLLPVDKEKGRPLYPEQKDLLMMNISSVAPPHELPDIKVLVDCLALLASDDNTPMMHV